MHASQGMKLPAPDLRPLLSQEARLLEPRVLRILLHLRLVLGAPWEQERKRDFGASGLGMEVGDE